MIPHFVRMAIENVGDNTRQIDQKKQEISRLKRLITKDKKTILESGVTKAESANYTMKVVKSRSKKTPGASMVVVRVKRAVEYAAKLLRAKKTITEETRSQA